MYTKIAILLLATVCLNCAFPQEYETVECGTTNITCVCIIGDAKSYIPLEIKLIIFDDPTTGKSKCLPGQNPFQACANVECVLFSNKSGLSSNNYFYEFATPDGESNSTDFNFILYPAEFTTPNGESNSSDLISRIYPDEFTTANGESNSSDLISRIYPDEFTTPNEESDSSDLISRIYPDEFTTPRRGYRHHTVSLYDACEVTELFKASVECWKWTSWINCNIKCFHGHVLPDGNETLKNISCRNTENIWKPHGFIECEPFFNCDVKLVLPGTLKCEGAVLDTPAYCNISCDADGKYYFFHPPEKYECLNASYAEILPDCAALKEKVSPN